MSGARKPLFGKHHEVGMYLLLGSLTTVMGGVAYYVVLLGGRALLGMPADEVTGVRYLTIYTAAQVFQWLVAALFAFFTNRKWVFTDADKERSLGKQLTVFFAGRLLTLGLDYVLTFLLTLGLVALFPLWTSVRLFGEEWNMCEIVSKLLTATVVVVCNYFISKIFVFQKKRANRRISNA